MLGSSYQVARIWGIPVKIHVSLIVLLLYVGLRGGLAVGSDHGLLFRGLIFLLHVLLMALVFLSVAVHELGHSYVAIRKGCRVRQITLMIIGGAAQMERIPSRPRDEFQMAVAGPLVSLLLGLMTLGLARALGWTTGAGYFFRTLGWINLLLAGFNLLPAFPMDGGRILRAALTPRMGRLPATHAAAQVGKWVAILMGIYGLVEPRNWILVGIAFFIYSAAGAEYRMMQVKEAMRSSRRFFGGFDIDDGDGADPVTTADEPDSADDAVIVGPPPYRHGPAQRVDIHREN